ncbi:MAG: MBL fold metallo-hydrolase [Eubacteriales bacterium]
MKITFYGGATVGTGSCYLIEIGEENLLVDCGMQRGQDEFDNNNLGFYASHLDHVIATHGRIDYGGRLPILVRDGFYGNIYTTEQIKNVLGIMLEEAAVVHTHHAERYNNKGRRKGLPPVEPLYTVADVQAAIQQTSTVAYGETITLSPCIKMRLQDGGHYFGSAIVELWLTEGDVTRKLVFSGCLGNRNKEGGKPPSIVTEADYVVLDAICCNEIHPTETFFKRDLAEVLDNTFTHGGTAVIPASMTGHCVELLRTLKQIKEEGLVSSVPEFPVYFDNGVSATIAEMSEKFAPEPERASEFTFEGLHRCATLEESRALNDDPTPKLIIAPMGDSEHGRVTHHLKHLLWSKNNTVILLGNQDETSLSQRLLDGITHVSILEEEFNVNATITKVEGMPSRADKQQLCRWMGHFTTPPERVFVVRTQTGTIEDFSEMLAKQGMEAHLPFNRQVYDLLENKVVEDGYREKESQRHRSRFHIREYVKLQDTVSELSSLARNPRINRMEDFVFLSKQIDEIITYWEEKLK